MNRFECSSAVSLRSEVNVSHAAHEVPQVREQDVAVGFEEGDEGLDSIVEVVVVELVCQQHAVVQLQDSHLETQELSDVNCE